LDLVVQSGLILAGQDEGGIDLRQVGRYALQVRVEAEIASSS
jgi:hypothetical protein